ncbi:MAG: succinate dehydrogenase, cytochrome b556 subunit [Sulfuricellaceae bacterium]|nr:succinate dehydrogenase, cytochrome b556 subunit [Sulfuricellaceae bacterium]
MAAQHKKRPVYLNLLQIRLPLPGMVSILHRLSGILLFLALPPLLALFQASLGSAEQFGEIRASLGQPFFKLLLLALLWAYLIHFFAGLRHLALDLHWGTRLANARRSAVLALALALVLTLAAGVALW